MKKWRLINIREYRKEGWFEIRPPQWEVYYHKYGSEETKKCNLITRLHVSLGTIWLYQGEMLFLSRLILSARILILLLAQALNLPQAIVLRLSTSQPFWGK